MLRSLALSLVVVLCGCRTTTPAATPPSATWELPMTFVGGLPVVQATIAGRPTLLVLDTGAPETTLQAWFVKSLEREPTDFEGHRVVEAALQVGGQNSTAKWPLVDDAPGQRELGIGGTLSPQHLVAKGAVAIDFPRKRLLALEGKANGWLLWLDERSPKGQVEALPRAAPFDGQLHVMTSVGDGREVATALATGNAHTSYPANLFDPSLIKDGRVAGLHLKIGQSEFGPLEVVVPPEGDPVGRIGMDVLQGAVLLVPVHELHPIWFMTPRE